MPYILLFGRASVYGGASGNRGLPTSGLVASWDLGSVAGQTVANQVAGGAALQLGSAAGVDAADPVATAAGLVFDGAASFCTAAALTVNSPITMIVIAKNADTTGTHPFIAGSGNSQLTFRSLIGGGIEVQQTNVATVVASSGTITDLAYHYIAASYDGAQGRMWREGRLNNTNNTALTITAFSPRIGVAAFNGAWMKGTLSHVAIYNRVLSAAEHLKAYQSLKSTWANRGVAIV